MSTKPTSLDIINLASAHFGISCLEAATIIKTPTHPHGLRDEFAGLAMQACLARGDDTNRPGIADWSYAMADAMLKARAA